MDTSGDAMRLFEFRCFREKSQDAGLEQLCSRCDSNGFGCLLCVKAQLEGVRSEQERGAALGKMEVRCQKGDPRACELQGDLLAKGVGALPDEQQASEVWNTACNRGSMKSCVKTAGWLARVGNNEDRLGMAAALLKRACDGGEPSGCRELGVYTVRSRKMCEPENERLPILSWRVRRRIRRPACIWGGLSGKDGVPRYNWNEREICSVQHARRRSIWRAVMQGPCCGKSPPSNTGVYPFV